MILRQYSRISGLKYFEKFISLQEKEHILSIINNHQWCHHLRRAQQYYGIKYFQTKIQDSVLQPVTSINHNPLFPFYFLIQKAIKNGLFEDSYPPNQILVNKYCKSDRLGLHVQDTAAFGPIIVGLSLGSTDYLRLVEVNNNNNAHLIQLKDCSCYVLTGEARYNFRHGIGRVISNQKYKDEQFQRISLTVRHVIETRRKVENNHGEQLNNQ